jgi:hypothetical protein
MEGEGSLVFDIVGDSLKGPLPEASTASSLSEASSLGVASDIAEAEAKVPADLRELARSYDFEAFLVMVSHIRQLESLRYFAEASVREPGEETVPEPNLDKVVVFKEFFAVGLRMPPHPAQILGPATSTDLERDCSDVEVFLGSTEL